MTTRIYIQFLTTVEKLGKEEKDLLKKVIKKHVKRAGDFLELPMINVTVYPNSNFVIPETGEGGYTPSKDWLQVYIDTTRNKKELKNIIEKIIPGTIYHEMNHAARRNHTGYGDSLMEVIISEGLATVFEQQHWSGYEAPWSEYTEKEINKLSEIVKKRNKKNDSSYDHWNWFYGTGELPRWLGYKVGTYIVKSFLSHNRDLSWKEIIKLDFREILRLSKINLT